MPTEETPATETHAEKDKPKYSKRLEGAQKMERRMSRAGRRMAEAVLAGIETWEDRRDRSASKKRDGAVKDALENSVRAYSKALRKSTRVTVDLMKGMRDVLPKRVQRLYGLR